MEQQIQRILRQMTLEDKIALCSGQDFWHTKAMKQYGIPAVTLSDGPHGLRKQQKTSDMLGINRSVPATCFPTASLAACSFDPDLLEEEGRAIAREAAANQVDVVLGPGACMKRNPLCGRNFEYFSEDPYLSGKLAAGWIRGAQQEGIGVSLKHFAANNQETKRFSSNSILDERTLRELYLTAFELAVQESHPSTVMCSYNKVNGTYSSDNALLLTKILRQEWGFDGLVVTDWGAMHDRTAGFQAGCDLMMPGGSAYGERDACAAVREGRLEEAAVDRCAARVLRLALHAARRRTSPPPADGTDHQDLARRVAENSITLLKNQDQVLPLSPGQSVALIGCMADTPRYQGAGSSHIQPTRLVSLRQAMPQAVYAPGCTADGSTTPALLAQAVQAARSVDTAIVVVGLPDSCESEGFDRQTMAMPRGHLQLIRQVAAANPRTVVILCCGSPVETPWADQVPAILYAGLSGQAGGEALASILTGRVNPSGRLAETWPMHYTDCPSHSFYGGECKDGQYREGIYVGYRYYEKAGVPVRFPFGYGLSYTTFAYRNLQWKDRTVTVEVTNTGTCPGKEAVLCYIGAPQDGIYRPLRELKRFAKIELQPGQTKTVSFQLDDRCFAIWQDDWVVPAGRYTVQIGPLSVAMEVAGQPVPAPSWQADSWYQTLQGEPSLQDWQHLIGYRYQQQQPVKGSFTMENTILEIKDSSRILSLLYRVMEGAVARSCGGQQSRSAEYQMMMASIADCSLSSAQINGGLPQGVMQGVLELANGHPLRAVGRMLGRR